MCHPNAKKKNEILFGSAQGELQLWDTDNQKLLKETQNFSKARVNILLQSPLPGVIAVGFDNGCICILDIETGKPILDIDQKYGSITSMSFRADGEPYLAVATDNGHIILWNLKTKKLSSQMRNAHSGPVKCCKFVRNEALLVTTGSDNAIKVWCLDMPDGSGRLLSQRSGHSEPPTYIRFYGSKGLNILSSGLDSTLKCFHIMSERFNRNLGTARINAKSKQKSLVQGEPNKLPPIVSFACESTREKEWDNIAAIHKNCATVTTWNYDKCKMGQHRIEQPTFDKHSKEATCVCITSCGNFLLIGFITGHIFKYNIQSGLFRLSFKTDKLSNDRAHEDAVTGIEVDALDVQLISVGVDKRFRIWNFKTGLLITEIGYTLPIRKLVLQRETNLIALASDDFSVKIVDLETRNLVRSFEGCKLEITDMCFTSDSRWIIVSSMDNCIRTWDISLGRLIDAFAVSSPCLSLTISPTGEFLATAHEGELGINLWSNFTVYCPVALSLIPEDHVPQIMTMPNVKCDDIQDDEDDDDVIIEEILAPETVQTYDSPEQLDKELISLSGLPSSRWKNLLMVDSIKAQQKIDEQMKDSRNKRTPFFIPVIDGLQPKFNINADTDEKDHQERQEELYKSRIKDLSIISDFGQLLLDCSDSGEYSRFFSELKTMGPSSTDAEIRSLGKDSCGTEILMVCFLDAIKQLLQSNLDFELASSWLALFLKIHTDVIYLDETLKMRCLEISEILELSWDRLSTEFNRSFSVLNYIRSAIL